jgi:hypothetical protein
MRSPWRRNTNPWGRMFSETSSGPCKDHLLAQYTGQIVDIGGVDYLASRTKIDVPTAPAAAPAGTVRYVSPTGSSTSPYDTWAKATTSLGTAISASSAGDTIILAAGTYAFPAQAEATKNNLTIRGETENPEDTVLLGTGHTGRVIRVFNPAILRKLTLVGGSLEPLYADAFVTFDDVIIYSPGGASALVNCRAGAGGSRLTLGPGPAQGLRLNASVDCVFGSIVITGTKLTGLWLESGAGNVTIKNLTINGCMGAAIRKSSASTGTLSVVNLVEAGNSGEENEETISNLSTGDITISNCLTLPRPPNFKHLSAGVVDGGGNIGLIEGSCLPVFTSTRYPIFLALCIDDISSLDYFEEFADLCEEFGYQSTFAATTQDITSAQYGRMASLVGRGFEIASHSVTHPNLATGGLTEEQVTDEVVNSKAAIEAGLAAQGTEYTVKSFVPPGNGTSATIQNIIQSAGYEGARGDTVYGMVSGVQKISFGKVYRIFAEEINALGETHIRRNTAAYLEYLGGIGGVACFYGHTDTYGAGEYTIEQWRVFFEEISKHPQVQVFTLGGLIEKLKTYDPNGDLTVLDSGHTYSRTLPDNKNHIPAPGSVLIGAGTDPFTNGDGDQYDAAGLKVWDDTYDIPDGHWIDGVDIGAYSYTGNDLYYHAEITAGTAYSALTIKLPAAPALIAADTNEVFFTSGVPQEVDLSTVASDDFVRIGAKRMVLVSEAQEGTCLAKTDKYVGD